MQHQRWHVYPDADALVARALNAVLRAAGDAIADRGAFRLVLAGGTTPKALYEHLAAAGAGDGRWQVFFGDERCLPAGHPDRNETMARAAWLDTSGIPGDRVLGVPAGPDPGTAAAGYAARLAGVPEFDLVLLGLGEDGHTASLFPGQDPGDGTDAADTLPVTDAPKPPAERVSLSAARLARARQVVFLVTGAGKREAVGQWRDGVDIPASRVAPDCGVDILVDRAAVPGF